jgi:hypothetical protein
MRAAFAGTHRRSHKTALDHSGPMEPRKITLRDEREGADSRHLWAYVDEDGNLRIEGQDLGPGTEMVSSDGEYEWGKTVAAEDVPRVVELLGGGPEQDILDLLEERYRGRESYELEKRLRESDIEVNLWVWSG